MGLAAAQDFGITCDQTGPSKCTKPALDYFIRRYEDRKTNPPTDERWSRDMLKQCQLDDTGRKCLITFARKCLPPQQVQQMNLDVKQNSTCEEKVDRLTKGCKSNSSVWFRTCENPLVERLHSFLTMTPHTVPPAQTEVQRIHTQICCEIDHYNTCIMEKAKQECNDFSTTIFQHIISDMRGSYQCDPRNTFSGIHC
ncbi:hypothetical protein RvY_01055 [Ramazzottius varieornatus]|uniref:Uncharacterized protein n=1 Tax=Ramazzottius varieornatus TaxID=947166 RepID=A0A1D1UFW4_RAMVA|nr:hypothetical protein RvY_01055 [Ramazzottius varieornatus]